MPHPNEGPSEAFMAAAQHVGDAFIRNVDAVGDMIFGALVNKLDAMTDNLKDKFSKGMEGATAYVQNAAHTVSSKVSSQPPMEARSQQISAPEKTPHISHEVVASAKQAAPAISNSYAVTHVDDHQNVSPSHTPNSVGVGVGYSRSV